MVFCTRCGVCDEEIRGVVDFVLVLDSSSKLRQWECQGDVWVCQSSNERVKNIGIIVVS